MIQNEVDDLVKVGRKVNSTDFGNMKKMLDDAGVVAIVTHKSPDGDGIGGCIAMKLYLESAGKSADMFVDDIVPNVFSYLPSVQQFNPKMRDKYDLLIILDASTEDRIGKYTELRKISSKVLCVDHHLNNVIQSDLSVVNYERASVGAIFYEYCVKYKSKVSDDMAAAIYTSVASDTGCFLFSNTTPYSHRLAADLMENNNIDVTEINYQNFRVHDRDIIPGFAYVMKSIKFFADGKIAVVALPYKMVKKYNLSNNERHEFKKFVSDIRGVVASAIATEEERGSFHFSLRSHGSVNISSVAEFFKGGGHKNAAGCTIKGEKKEVMAAMVEQIKKVIKESN